MWTPLYQGVLTRKKVDEADRTGDEAQIYPNISAKPFWLACTFPQAYFLLWGKIYSVDSSIAMISIAYLERAVKVNQMSKSEKAKVGL